MQVLVYTQPDCPPCEFTKNFLTEHGITFTIKDIKKDPKARNDLLKLGSYSTPTLVIGEQVITGFLQDQIESALGLDLKK